jgi:hypothetical protein
MTWGAVAGAAVGVVGNALTSDRNGGAGTQTQSKEPWAAAQPWIMNNLAQGQNLQNAYTAQPFNALQQQAYGNQQNQSDYMRAAIPSLLGQMSGKQIGLDRSNPNARPEAFNFNTLLGAAGAGNAAAQQGALSRLNSGPSLMGNLTAQTPQVAAPAPAAPSSMFVNQSGGMGNSMAPVGWNKPTTGSYGSFQYGQMPAPGSQAETDLRMYLALGGSDPQNLYGGYRVGGGGGGMFSNAGGNDGPTGSGASAAAAGASGAF